MTDQEINSQFTFLWNDIEQGETFPQKRPMLAHYTSIETLESILKHSEMWFSNPLHMNDLEELRFGVEQGTAAFRESHEIRLACGSDERYRVLSEGYERYLGQFYSEHALDTYVVCFSEHESGNQDGLLSMWRGYGGHGHAAAIIFDLAKLNHVEGAPPLIVSKVIYGSREMRLAWIAKKISGFAEELGKIQTQIPVDKLFIAAFHLFERIKMFAIFSKHEGFREEREWRAVYLRERDRAHLYDSMLGYSFGPHGVQPKLKLKIQPMEHLSDKDLSLSKIVDRVILGPTTSTPLALWSVKRMMNILGHPEMTERVVVSGIPFRK